MTWTSKRDAMKPALRALTAAIPETARAFAALGKTVKTDGALDIVTKELVAIGIAVSQRCEPCITFHVEAFLRAGGRREALAEALGMAVQMGGGPSLMYSAKALECFDEFAVPAQAAE